MSLPPGRLVQAGEGRAHAGQDPPGQVGGEGAGGVRCPGQVRRGRGRGAVYSLPAGGRGGHGQLQFPYW